MRVRTSGLRSGPWGRMRRELWAGVVKWLGPVVSVGWIVVGACGWGGDMLGLGQSLWVGIGNGMG